MTVSVDQTTDGWRGEPGETWSEVHMLGTVVTLAENGWLGPTVALGYDGRGGARDLARLAAQLLVARGHAVHLSDSVLPTPALGWYVRQHAGVHAGLMFTASHNPPGYVGLKFRNNQGQGVLQPPIDPADPFATPLPSMPASTVDVLGAYVESVGAALRAAVTAFAGSVVLDAAYGAVGALRRYGIGPSWSRADVLPFFAGCTPDPVLRPQADTVAEAAMARARDPDRTLVAMTDGDGDRLVLYTRRSGYIDSSEQAAILVAAGSGVDELITTVVAPRKVVGVCAARGVAVRRVSVGFKHVVAAWEAAGRPRALGVEPNGALVVATGPDAYFERDALGALAVVLNRFDSVGVLDEAVATLRAGYPHPQRLLACPLPLERVREVVDRVLGPGTVGPGGTVQWEDQRWWVVARRAGTEDVTRVYAETDAARYEQVCHGLAGELGR